MLIKSKNKINVVYSTNPDFNYQYDEPKKVETLPAEKQHLRITFERKNRGGKTVTVISGFVGTQEDLSALAKEIKLKCGVGGSTKDGEIIIQGDFREKISRLLSEKKYRIKN